MEGKHKISIIMAFICCILFVGAWVSGEITGLTKLPPIDITPDKTCKTKLNDNGWTNLSGNNFNCLNSGICYFDLANHGVVFERIVFNQDGDYSKNTTIQNKIKLEITNYINKFCNPPIKEIPIKYLDEQPINLK
jgi:hypothetical protein